MDLLKSKKFQAALIGLAVVVVKHFLPDLDETSVQQILAVLLAYIIGQGIADHGKEKAKIEQR
jgi:hypothetical protein